jgi:hypothetical protein
MSISYILGASLTLIILFSEILKFPKEKKEKDQSFIFIFLKDQRYYNIQVHVQRLGLFFYFF